MNRIAIVALLVCLFSSQQIKGEQPDSLHYRNVIKYNISAPLLWGTKNFIFEYERIISPTMSANIGLGYRTLPKLVGIGKSDSAFVVRDHINKGGFSGSVDFRFYLKKENKFHAPRGIYIGPYVSYFSTNIENTFSTFYNDIGSFKATTGMKVLNSGFQLGYQFVFFERLSLDICFVGPSISWYYFSLQTDGSLNLEDSDFYDELADYISENYPVANVLLNDFSISGIGRSSKLFFGYRYYFTIGFLF
ncbi:MAG: hypothetical protein KAR45_19450 [Desulfobacteraceae bacterium]|nr:hypothetical protein [Desulfobacteraceae bacterium]